MRVSVVISTIDSRAELLERSLWCYTKQILKPEVIVVADRPKSKETEELVKSYQDRLDTKYFELGGPPGWRNGYGQNRGIHESVGEIVVVTHPEVMMEPDNVQAIVDRINGEDNVCAMLMWVWLSKEVNERLGETDEWREDMSFIRNIVTQEDYGWLPRVGNLAPHAKSVLHAIKVAPNTSPTFWQSAAMTRKTWLRMGGFTLMNTWGSMDQDFIKRKRILGIPTKIVPALSYHQWHPQGPVHNEFEVFEYNKPEDAIRELRWE
jgi:glycosyltransferase involved in cell wall biosynthesis